MILFDFNGIVISGVTGLRMKPNAELVRYVMLSNLMTYKKMFGEVNDSKMVICFDGRNYWRKQVFPNYKGNRRKSRSADSFDWDMLFSSLNQVKQEMKDELPFTLVEYYGAEADDVIAVLSSAYCKEEDRIIIVSSDKDLLQIKAGGCNRIKQWSPLIKRYIDEDTNDYSLFLHVVRGDSGDGIPNILSDDDVFITSGKRSKQIRETTIDKWKVHGIDKPELFCTNDDMLRRFNRNRTIIDFSCIPDDIQRGIIKEFESQQKSVVTFTSNIERVRHERKSGVLAYLKNHNMNNFLSSPLCRNS